MRSKQTLVNDSAYHSTPANVPRAVPHVPEMNRPSRIPRSIHFVIRNATAMDGQLTAIYHVPSHHSISSSSAKLTMHAISADRHFPADQISDQTLPYLRQDQISASCYCCCSCQGPFHPPKKKRDMWHVVLARHFHVFCHMAFLEAAGLVNFQHRQRQRCKSHRNDTAFRKQAWV